MKRMQKPLNVDRKMKRVWAAVILIMIFGFAASAFYLNYAWNRYRDIASAEAIQLAQSLESVLPVQHIAELTGSAEDLENPEYVLIRNKLAKLVKTTNPIRFAYLMKEQDGKIIFLLDSESVDSPAYSPPGQVYAEADDIVWQPFRSGITVLTPPRSDRWGTWISALVPIKDAGSGNVVAIFGIDYSALEWQARLWKSMIPDMVIIFCIIVILGALIRIWLQHTSLKKLNKKLAADEALYRGVFEQAPIGIAIVKDKNFIYQSQSDFMNINPTFEQILGRKGDVLNQTKWTEITHPDDLQADLEKFKEFKNGSIGGYTMEKRFLRPDGSSVWTNMKISALSGFFSENFMHLCLVEDITARRQTEDLLRENERRQEVFFSRLPGLAYRCKYDRDGTMLLVSDGCGELTGYPPESFINNRDLAFNSIIDPKYRTLLWQEWQRTVPKRQSYKCEYEITTSDGEKKWVLELGQGVYKDDGEVEALEGIILDISDRKEMENRLRYINEHDAWTGLHNLDYLQKLLAHDAGHAAMPARALISINLSTVQLITANYGFHYTQTLMKKAAETLEPYSSANRMLFKTYENRFVFYMKEYRDLNELLQFAEEIAGSLEELFLSERIGGGIGILEINKDSEADVDLLLKRLLIASEMAINIYEKEFRVCVYDKDVEAQVNRDLEIRQELTRIASEDSCGELFLQYQPILNLKTNKVCSFEALARLRTEKLGWVPPLEFIPVAEKTKLIIPIGDKIIFKALSFLRKLKEQGYENTGVSINISAFQLIKPGFADGFEEMIREMQVNPENIGIEITESVFTSDYDNMNRLIRKLREAGLHVAIDDFGTGYSSLAREKELQVNCLKIDKYFIDKLLVDGNDKAITGHIISMAHKLGHCTVAEGVECEAQKQYLLDNGCDKIQGYLVSGPLDEEAAIELLRRQEDFRIR